MVDFSHTWVIGQDSPAQISGLFKRQADKGIRVFCFDYFDTLIVRDIEPEYSKQLAAGLHSRFLHQAIAPEQLYAIRQELEKKLCEQSAAAGGELEFYLEPFSRDYHELLLAELGQIAPLRDLEYFTRFVLAAETAVELAVQRPLSQTVEVLAWLREQGMTTVLISDFYLPGSCFSKMLTNIGIQDQFDHVYISADHGLAKGSGRLYEKVCRDLDCLPEQMLMIGDNLHSDVNMAREQGMQSIHLQNPVQKSFYQQWQPADLTVPERVKQRFSDCLHSTGMFKEISTSLWSFTWMLFQELQQNKVTDVFFFSKEGEFLKRLFDRLQKDLFGCRIITCHYILVSRKATFLASLRPLAEEDFIRFFAHYRDVALRDFLLSLNLEESLALSLCEELGLDFNTRHSDLQNRIEFQQLLASDSFRELYETRRREQRHNFIAYLDSFAVDYSRDGLSIVDVGWKGSIQDNVYHILQGSVAVQGYFVGSLIATEARENNRKQGLLFDDTRPELPYFNVYNNNRSLFEMILGASHGSADGYFIPQQYEALPDDHQREIQQRIKSKDGELLVATLDLPKERLLFEEKIKPIQQQIYDEAKKMNRACLASGCTSPDHEWFARHHARMVFKPTRAEVEFFERLYHLENFGIFEYTDFRTEGELSFSQCWKNFRMMRKDPSILEMGTWPPIILRRLGLDWYRHINGYRRFKREFK